MRKQYRKLLTLTLCLAMAFTLMAVPAFADEEQPEPVAGVESVEPIEEPVEEPVEDTHHDGDWCSNEESHWRADAVNQGIPAPHVDEDEDEICDVCQRDLSADKPVEVPVGDTHHDGDWCSDEENHWRADAVNQGMHMPHVDEDKDGVCDVCRRDLSADKPVEVPGGEPLDGDWCSDEENHWRADAVNQGIHMPHVDEDKDGVCDVCQRDLSADEPVEVPGGEHLVGDWCFDEENHWRADAVNQGIPVPHEFDEDGACIICGFVKSADNESGAGSEEEEPPASPGSGYVGTLPSGETTPKTGDESGLAAWTVLLLLSAGALAGVVPALRKLGKQ